MKLTCKYCHKTYSGDIDYLKSIFVIDNNKENGLTNLCKKCKAEYYHTKKYLNGEGSRVTVEELIDTLNEIGYPLNKDNLDKFLIESYQECDLSLDEWMDWIEEDFYSHENILNILDSKIKKCRMCNNWLPESVYTTSNSYKNGKKYVYKTSYCKRCYNKKCRDVWTANRTKSKEKRKEYYNKNREKLVKTSVEWKRNNKYTIKKLNMKYNIKKYLIDNNYEFDEDMLPMLVEIKLEKNIRLIKDVVDQYGRVVKIIKK